MRIYLHNIYAYLRSCARDGLQQMTAGRACSGNGDYATLQTAHNMEFCADPGDGWRVGKWG